MEIQEIIEATVNATIAKLKIAGLMRDNNMTAYQKTEQALKAYNDIVSAPSKDTKTEKFIKLVNEALERLVDDPYYEVIPMTYFLGYTREQVAEYFETTTTTISRHKTRLINKLKPLIFSDQVIIELFL